MKTNKTKRCIDIILTIVLLFLTAYQVTGEFLHEWLGIGMTVIVTVHQILNRRWYMSVTKGKYNPYRTVLTVTDCLLVLCFFTTAFCGMAISNHAVPFMNGLIPSMLARQLHLALSYWSFVLIGIHIGFHLSTPVFKMKKKGPKAAVTTIWASISVYGFVLFIKANIFNYMFFITHFAFLDYSKNPALVIFENLVMLSAWAFAGGTVSMLLKIKTKNKNTNKIYGRQTTEDNGGKQDE
jgi:hypothetical protein